MLRHLLITSIFGKANTTHNTPISCSHAIFSHLLQLKQALSSLEGLDFHASGIGDSEDENISLEEDEPEDLNDAQPTCGALEVDVNADEESAVEDADGYHSLVQKRKREQKQSEKTAYETAKAENRRIVLVSCVATGAI